MTVANKVIVITGASSGLGEATALHLARMGAKLVLGARRSDRLAALTERIRIGGGEAIHRTTDVTRRDDVEALVAAGVEAFGGIDVLISNAGIMPLSPLSKLLVEEWDRTIDVNIKGVMYGIAAALPRFQAQKSGHFINISSVAGIKVLSPVGSVYSATKFAVRALSEGLRSEVGRHVRTTIISPGATESELHSHSSDPETNHEVRSFYQIYQITPDSVARAIAFAIDQPADVDINEIVLRPTAQDF